MSVLREGNKWFPGGEEGAAAQTGWGGGTWLGRTGVFKDQHSTPREKSFPPTALSSSSTLYRSPLWVAPSPGPLRPPHWLCTPHLGEISALAVSAGNLHPCMGSGTRWAHSHLHLHLQGRCPGWSAPDPHLTPPATPCLCPVLQAPLRLHVLFPLQGTAFLGSDYLLRGAILDHLIPSPPYTSLPRYVPSASLSLQRLCSFTRLLAVCPSPHPSLGPMCLAQSCEHTPSVHIWRINIEQ